MIAIINVHDLTRTSDTAEIIDYNTISTRQLQQRNDIYNNTRKMQQKSNVTIILTNENNFASYNANRQNKCVHTYC